MARAPPIGRAAVHTTGAPFSHSATDRKTSANPRPSAAHLQESPLHLALPRILSGGRTHSLSRPGARTLQPRHRPDRILQTSNTMQSTRMLGGTMLRASRPMLRQRAVTPFIRSQKSLVRTLRLQATPKLRSPMPVCPVLPPLPLPDCAEASSPDTQLTRFSERRAFRYVRAHPWSRTRRKATSSRKS